MTWAETEIWPRARGKLLTSGLEAGRWIWRPTAKAKQRGARAGDAALVHASAGSVNTGHASFMKQGMQAEAGSGDAGKRRR